MEYVLNALWMGKRLGRLLYNATKVNVIIEEEKKGKGKRVSMSEKVGRIPKLVLGGPNQCGARHPRGVENLNALLLDGEYRGDKGSKLQHHTLPGSPPQA